MNEYSVHIYYFDLLMKGQIDQKVFDYSIELKDNEDPSKVVHENRVFMVIPFILYKGIQKLNFQSFFQTCRKEEIQYDFKTLNGSSFSFYDKLDQSNFDKYMGRCAGCDDDRKRPLRVFETDGQNTRTDIQLGTQQR